MDRFKFRVAIKQPDGTYKRYPVEDMLFCNPISAVYRDGSKEFPYGRDVEIDGDKAILEQCTGSPDKNKELIYDGHIVLANMPDLPKLEAVVKWKRGAWWLEYDDASDDTLDRIIQDGATLEIIGNLHEK